MAGRKRAYKTFKNILIVAALIRIHSESNRFNPWISVNEITRQYNDSIGKLSHRSIDRYVGILQELEIVEVDNNRCARADGTMGRRFKFVSYDMGVSL